MPPDPPRWAANAALATFGGTSAPPLQNYFLRLCCLHKCSESHKHHHALIGKDRVVGKTREELGNETKQQKHMSVTVYPWILTVYPWILTVYPWILTLYPWILTVYVYPWILTVYAQRCQLTFLHCVRDTHSDANYYSKPHALPACRDITCCRWDLGMSVQ